MWDVVQKKNTVVVHHQHCASLKNACRQSLAKWDNVQSAVNFEAELQIEILNEQNALLSLMTAISASESSLQNIWTEELENNLLLVILQVCVKISNTLPISFIALKVSLASLMSNAILMSYEP